MQPLSDHAVAASVDHGVSVFDCTDDRRGHRDAIEGTCRSDDEHRIAGNLLPSHEIVGDSQANARRVVEAGAVAGVGHTELVAVAEDLGRGHRAVSYTHLRAHETDSYL